MKISLIFLAVGLAFFSPHYTVAQDTKSPAPKIAVVDLMKVFEAHPETKLATDELTKDREAMRDEFKEKSNSLKEVLQKHQELIRASKREAAAEKLKEANELEKAIATLRTTQQRDLEEKFRRAKAKILAAISKSVQEYNADGKYAVILDSSSKSSNGLPQVIHAPGAEDITDAIIAKVKEAKSE
ncbi:MAG: OmpH family outer membrane protein [Verrucomicrobiales bacterium]|nr:OmpH family outer membrane protein [Verrucomicrobiales bacterium]